MMLQPVAVKITYWLDGKKIATDTVSAVGDQADQMVEMHANERLNQLAYDNGVTYNTVTYTVTEA